MNIFIAAQLIAWYQQTVFYIKNFALYRHNPVYGAVC